MSVLSDEILNSESVELPAGMEAPEGYLILEKGVYKDTGDDKIKMISAAPFYITGRLLNRERGEKSYIVKLVDDEEKEILLVKCKGGAKAIVRAVECEGIYLRNREAEEYVTEYIEWNWAKMRVTEQVDENDDYIEFESVYEQLVHFVRHNEEKFEQQLWGRFGDDNKTIYVRITVMNEFLSGVGISNKEKTLKYWRSNGILHAAGDGKHLTRSVRIGGHIQRAYVIEWSRKINEKENNIKTINGLKAGDKTSLVDLKTGGVINVQLLEKVDVKEADNSKISVVSPMGKALLGKVAGDMVNVVVEGKVVGEYKVVKS